MKQYLALLNAVLKNGTPKSAARSNMPGSTSLFGYQFSHDLSKGFPLLTTKKIFWKGVVAELLWFLSGDTNVKTLVDQGVNIWNEDAYRYYLKQIKKHNLFQVGFESFVDAIKKGHDCEFLASVHNGLIPDYTMGDCGEQYGALWRRWDGGRVDQIAELIKGLRETPESRRHIITAWNPSTLDQMALNACHAMVQFNCRPLTVEERTDIVWQSPLHYKYWAEEAKKTDDWHLWFDRHNVPRYGLDCQLYQRSADAVLGVPFNIASYALLTHILANMCGMIPGKFVHTFGDLHIYDNHREAATEQLTRDARPLPELEITSKLPADIDEFVRTATLSDFKIKNYNPHPAIKAKLSTGL